MKHRQHPNTQRPSRGPCMTRTILGVLALGLGMAGLTHASSSALKIKEAEWEADEHKLEVEGKGRKGERIVVSNAADPAQILGSRKLDEKKWEIKVRNPHPVPCRVRVEQSDGQYAEKDVKNAPADCGPSHGGGGGTGGGGTGGGGGNPPPVTGNVRVLGSNDLGMHCADQDYQIMSILPPFNVLHVQAVLRGTQTELPRLLDDTYIEMVYQATSSPNDPAGAGSINTTSQNLPGVFKGNFWDDSGKPLPAGVPNAGSNYTWGGAGYASLYPGVQVLASLGGPDLASLCTDPVNLFGCPSALALFEPMPADTGLPVPDVERLFPHDGSAPELVTAQQNMPGLSNTPQRFERFLRELPFFVDFPFGTRIPEAMWFAAEGIPLMPVDDDGNRNAYPLLRVSALEKATGNELGSIDLVAPVASEADCQNCHVDPIDCADPRLPADLQSTQCTGAAVFQTPFQVATIDDAPGDTPEQKLLNAAKINILRLHDAKHGAKYRNWDSNKQLVSMVCDAAADPNDPDCLDNQRPIQCSRCHYSPALDLAQAGPVDEPEQGLQGRQQTYHVSMSRAMHEHHGTLPPYNGQTLFPSMPSPAGRDPQVAEQVLEQTCYQCHPGKRTQCLRGAMFSGGVVCQDCHGDMEQVGNDFSLKVSTSNPGDFVLDGSLRVPWANEPMCQSCHAGDALNPNHPAGAIVADDGIRLLQAYVTQQITVPGVGQPVKIAAVHHAPGSRFAENQGKNANGQTVDVLYRLSKGHGGIKCEGCHNSTHAIWPNANPFANDNIAAEQLQGHAGTLIECTTCHEPTDKGLPLELEGPHGMHPIADYNGPDQRWNDKHEDVFEKSGKAACQSCHGVNGEGTVLSRTAAERKLKCKNSKGSLCTSGQKFVTVAKGTPIGCANCHENELIKGGD